MDLSRAMVQEAQKLSRREQIAVDIHQADALHLPYADACFDAVVHYGAINQFGGGKWQAIDEMVRVTKCRRDDRHPRRGYRPGKDTTWWARRLMWRNASVCLAAAA